MASYGDLTQSPALTELFSAKMYCYQASMITFCFRKVSKIPFGPMTLALLIDQHLSDTEKEVWVGLQKLFKHMCAEYQRIHAKPLLSKDWRRDDVKIFEMWARFRVQPRTGQPLKKLGYAAWDDGHFFKSDYQEQIDSVLCKIQDFGLLTGIQEVIKEASAIYGANIDVSGGLE
ncbi:MAG: hypothetical protein L6R38_006121 [Xanthoria sp. 2 TBL-2021]|nr:MAG: hypothetical protein L6R38_006121 [Xanthoria sp. 2 TBL-2021]